MSDSAQRLSLHPISGALPVPDNLHLRLFAIDSLTIAAEKWNTHNVQSPFWRFYQNQEEGAYIDLANGERFPFHAGQVYLIPSGVWFSCGNHARFRHFYIHFDLLGLSRLTMRTLFAGPVALPEDMSFSAQIAVFSERAIAGKALDIVAHCRAKALIYEGLARYLHSLSPEMRQRLHTETAEQAALAPALSFIEDNLHCPVTVPQLAERCCLSPDHFARRFKASLGQTPIDYLRERRVQFAAQRLLFSSDTLERIAESCGFGSRHYLTRVFTQVMGIPPATYRKQGSPPPSRVTERYNSSRISVLSL